MASRKTKKQRQREKNGVFRDFERNLISKGLPRGTKVGVQSTGRVKMSEVLLDFIEPYTEEAQSEDEFRSLITMGLVAWNTALLPEEIREQTLDRLIDEAVRDGADDFRQVVYEMIERKQRGFAQIKRLMLKYDLTVSEKGCHLSVISTPASTREIWECRT